MGSQMMGRRFAKLPATRMSRATSGNGQIWDVERLPQRVKRQIDNPAERGFTFRKLIDKSDG
jgi:hypothetical protein